MEHRPEFYSHYASPIGTIVVRAHDTGVLSVSFSESAGQPSLPNLLVKQAIAQLDDYFRGKLTAFTIPLAPEGTAFEELVWQSLRGVAFGDTCSYRDIATRLQNPKAIRAVGRANGANPIAILIPCHRVIGSDGSLTGYAGGMHRKRWLLDHEARIAGTQLF
jgi:methylated-DNA-[protein]-cysteine S-methyltransferase